jgi:hypothetical protein
MNKTKNEPAQIMATRSSNRPQQHAHMGIETLGDLWFIKQRKSQNKSWWQKAPTWPTTHIHGNTKTLGGLYPIKKSQNKSWRHIAAIEHHNTHIHRNEKPG